MSPDDIPLHRLRCPRTHQPLELADAALLEANNARAQRAELKTVGAEALPGPIAGGAVRADRAVLYPLDDGVLCLIPERGVDLSWLVK